MKNDKHLTFSNLPTFRNDGIRDIFDRMDDWRHLPDYQLERRADIFFSLYLPEVLEAKLRFPMRSEMIPEFPVRKGTINSVSVNDNRSCKIDYVALSKDGNHVVFVEVKTDMLSRRVKQDNYISKAQKAEFGKLLHGIKLIVGKSKSKRKYICLLKRLESLGLMCIPAELTMIMNSSNFRGLSAAISKVEIIWNHSKPRVVYVQPTGRANNIISFSEFADIVERHDDPLSKRFASSLRKWAEIKAGVIS